MIATILLGSAALPAAIEVRRFAAAEARQGVAAGHRSFYAIDNSTIARYNKRSGRQLAIWRADPVRYPHINSCAVVADLLVCANSNYPAVPMRSSVVWLDAKTLAVVREHDLGAGFGSLTWLDWRQDSWWACYAHYDGKGGEPGRDHRATRLVRYDAEFRVIASYRFPDEVLAHFAPRSASGGAWGRNGALYVSGHDRPEIYRLAVPKSGTTLILEAVIATPTHGQAIGIDRRDANLLWSIDRSSKAVVESRLP